MRLPRFKSRGALTKALKSRHGLWGTLIAWRQATAGASAVEFALIAPFLFLTIIFLMSVGYMIFMQQSLDYATQKAARLIRTGQTQAAGISSPSAFATQTVCPFLPSMFNCNNLIVYAGDYPTNVWVWWSYPYTVFTPYINASNTGLITQPLNNNGSFCPGSASYYVFLQVFYPVPFFLSFLSSSTLATTYNGQSYYVIRSTAFFLNEPFTATAAC